MRLSIIDLICNRAKDRNDFFLLGLKGLLAESLDSPRSVGSLASTTLRLKAKDLTNAYTLEESEILVKESASLAEVAYADAMRDMQRVGEPSSFLREFVMEEVKQVLTSLSGQATRDAGQAERKLRSISMQVGMLLRQREWKRSAALIAVRSQQANQMKFNFVDRSGKSWDSSRYVFTVLRHHYVRVYNEVYLYAMAEYGKTVAYVKHEDPDHAWNNLKFGILSNNDGLTTYAEIEKEVFNPNTRAFVSHLK
jgi:hypothetical protein